MKIRDLYATLSDDKTEHTMPSGGLEIIADDGRILFSIRAEGTNGILITASGVIKHGGVMLDDSLRIKPNASNQVGIYRPTYNK